MICFVVQYLQETVSGDGRNKLSKTVDKLFLLATLFVHILDFRHF
ncbi:hypothetical protein TcasGA2_TC032749 [Tribolium castaneum]|uniref:Uncharacterized protein n=1 Tax=Tribolium castaneum TaxID=7070 RepID=A0A139WIP2_TRICA|nr:hypothetical protein TcasGA2_TC032749 [Tribolium castaneum]